MGPRVLSEASGVRGGCREQCGVCAGTTSGRSLTTELLTPANTRGAPRRSGPTAGRRQRAVEAMHTSRPTSTPERDPNGCVGAGGAQRRPRRLFTLLTRMACGHFWSGKACLEKRAEFVVFTGHALVSLVGVLRFRSHLYPHDTHMVCGARGHTRTLAHEP